MIWPLLRFFGRNCQIFSLVFWKISFLLFFQKLCLKTRNCCKEQPLWNRFFFTYCLHLTLITVQVAECTKTMNFSKSQNKFSYLSKFDQTPRSIFRVSILTQATWPLVDNLSTCLEYPTWHAITINFIFRKRAHKVYVLCNELGFASMQIVEGANKEIQVFDETLL